MPIELKEKAMKIRDRFFMGVIFLAAAFGAALPGLGQERAETKVLVDPMTAFRVTEGFQEALSLKTKTGKAVALKVTVRTWSIDGILGRQTIRTSDFTLFHLRGGKIKALIAGKEEMKIADAYWTLPAGAVLTLQVKGETALLDAMTVSAK
jgi:hypothetical protein